MGMLAFLTPVCVRARAPFPSEWQRGCFGVWPFSSCSADKWGGHKAGRTADEQGVESVGGEGIDRYTRSSSRSFRPKPKTSLFTSSGYSMGLSESLWEREEVFDAIKVRLCHSSRSDFMNVLKHPIMLPNVARGNIVGSQFSTTGAGGWISSPSLSTCPKSGSCASRRRREREWECLNKQLAAAAALAALTDICTTNIFRRPSYLPLPLPPYYSTSPYFFPDQMEHFQPISGIRSSRNHLFISSTSVLRYAHLENPFTAAHKLSSCIEKLQM